MPHPRSLRRRPRALAVLALSLTLVAFPLGVLASHQYSDVPNANPFHGDITAITNAGVTSGCGGGQYCPDRNVTRAEMAAFMNRLGALASNKTPVVNADKLDGLNSTDFGVAGVRATAAGVVSTWFNRAGAKPTINKAGTGVYHVTIPGRSFNINLNFIATANTLGSPAGIVSLDSVSGNVIVYTFDAAGTATDLQFTLAIWDAGT